MPFALLLLAFACTSIVCDAEIDDNLAVDSNCEGGANTCRASYEDDAVVLLQTKHSLKKDQSVEQTQEDNDERGKTSQSESIELMEERNSKGEDEKEQMKERGLLNEGGQEQDGDLDGGSDGRDDAEEDQDEAQGEKEDEDEEEEEEQEDAKHEETQELAEEDPQEEDEKEDDDENSEEPESNAEPEANDEMADNTNSTGLLMESAHVNSTRPARSVVNVAEASYWPANRVWAATLIASLMRGDCMKDTAGHCLGRSCPAKYQCYVGVCTGGCHYYFPHVYDCGAYCTHGYIECKHKTLGILYSLGEAFSSLLPVGATAAKLSGAARAGRTKFMQVIAEQANGAAMNLARKFGEAALENVPKIALALPGISKGDTKTLLDEGMKLIALKAHATKGNERVLCETIIQAVDPTGLTSVYNAFAADKCKWWEELPSLSRRRRARRRRTWRTSAPRTRRRYVHVGRRRREPVTPSPTPGGPRRRYVPASRRRRYTAYVVESGHTSAPGTRRRYVPITTRVR